MLATPPYKTSIAPPLVAAEIPRAGARGRRSRWSVFVLVVAVAAVARAFGVGPHTESGMRGLGWVSPPHREWLVWGVFGGVTLCAAATATLLARFSQARWVGWGLALAGGALAALHADNLGGGLIGLAILVILLVRVVFRASVALVGWSLTTAYGGCVGAVSAGCLAQGGWDGGGRAIAAIAVGIAGAVWLADPLPESLSRRPWRLAARKLTHAAMLAGGFAIGALIAWNAR